MAFSKPITIVQDTFQDEETMGQHYLVCGTEHCKMNCQFYCNLCHQQICQHCRDEHHSNLETKQHEVVPYRERKRKLPVEKCKYHCNNNINTICKECQVLICNKCAIHDHQGHVLHGLEEIYSNQFVFCQEQVYKINRCLLPTSKKIRKDIKDDVTRINAEFDWIRTSIKDEAESLKSLVDTVTSDNIEHVNKLEESMTNELQNQEKIFNEYISYLKSLVKTFQGYLTFDEVQNNPIIYSLNDNNRLTIQPIPETTKPVPPTFTAGQYSKEDVTKLLGRVTVPDIKPEKRKIKPTEFVSTKWKPTIKPRKKVKEKSNTNPTLHLTVSVTKVRELKVPCVKNVCHISKTKSGRLWISDNHRNLVELDLQGNLIQLIQTCCGSKGNHTVTQFEDLIFTESDKHIITTITLDNNVTEFIKTGDWEPVSIHSSRINGDILVGMVKDGEAKVTTYNKKGEEIQNIQWNNKGKDLYSDPHYITENINGDICTSDYDKQAVVVVNQSGQHRFSYTGQGSEVYPYGICTDIFGHILVCDENSNSVHLLDENGQLLSLLMTQHLGIHYPLSVCVDDEKNLYLGESLNTVTVLKYLK